MKKKRITNVYKYFSIVLAIVSVIILGQRSEAENINSLKVVDSHFTCEIAGDYSGEATQPSMLMLALASEADEQVCLDCSNRTFVSRSLALDKASNSTTSNSKIVYITRTGKKYHTKTCKYVKGKDDVTPKTIEEAKAMGLTACKVCKP